MKAIKSKLTLRDPLEPHRVLHACKKSGLGRLCQSQLIPLAMRTMRKSWLRIKRKRDGGAKCHLSRLQCKGSEVWVEMDTKSDRWETQPRQCADHVIRVITYLVYSHCIHTNTIHCDSFQLSISMSLLVNNILLRHRIQYK